MSICRTSELTNPVYYGQEQDVSDGAADPVCCYMTPLQVADRKYNRNALWAEGHGNYKNSTTYERIKTLNLLRHTLITNGTQYQGKTFLQSPTTVITETANDVAIRKGPVVSVLTNVSRTLNSRGQEKLLMSMISVEVQVPMQPLAS